MTTSWTPRDLDIVETLTRRVRMLSLEQIERIWWPSVASLRVVRRRLRMLTSGGLLSRIIVNVHPPLEVTRPLASWSFGQDVLDFSKLSQHAKNRWTQSSVPQEIYCATPVAANLFGSTARELSGLTHRDHDLLLGQVYVVYRTTRPTDAAAWLGEDALPKAGYRIKDPDAFLVDDHGRFIRVIESAGRYSRSQIESFHEHCVDKQLPYELW